MFGMRTPPQEAPCDTCTDEKKRVELLPENEVAAKIFIEVRGQTINIWNGEQDIPVDLNHLAVWKAIEKFPGGIRDEWEVFNKINRAWHSAEQNKRDRDG